MKNLATVLFLLLSVSGFCQKNYNVLLKAEKYSINDVVYEQPDILFALQDTILNVKPVGDLKLVKKAVSIKETSIYQCEFEGKKVEVITVIKRENFRITVRGEGIDYVIKADFPGMAPRLGVGEAPKRKALPK